MRASVSTELTTRSRRSAPGRKLDPRFVNGLGIAGIVGSSLLIVSEMLYYFLPDRPYTPYMVYENLGWAAAWRTRWASALTLPAILFCLCGSAQVYLAFQTAPQLSQALMGTALFIFSISLGLLEMHQAVMAAFSEVILTGDLNPALLLQEPITTDRWIRYALTSCLAFMAYVFIPCVWKGQTHYPRWVCGTFPLVLFMLRPLFIRLATSLESSLFQQLVVGPFHQYMFLIFFISSTVGLWNNKTIKAGIWLPVEEGHDG